MDSFASAANLAGRLNHPTTGQSAVNVNAVASDLKGVLVGIRYVGFEQRQNFRAYQFDRHEKGQPTAQFIVTADMAIFRMYHVAIQEGPSLSGNKLIADLEQGWQGKHELTANDMSAYVSKKSLAEAKAAENAKARRRRSAQPEQDCDGPPSSNFGT